MRKKINNIQKFYSSFLVNDALKFGKLFREMNFYNI